MSITLGYEDLEWGLFNERPPHLPSSTLPIPSPLQVKVLNLFCPSQHQIH